MLIESLGRPQHSAFSKANWGPRLVKLSFVLNGQRKGWTERVYRFSPFASLGFPWSPWFRFLRKHRRPWSFAGWAESNFLELIDDSSVFHFVFSQNLQQVFSFPWNLSLKLNLRIQLLRVLIHCLSVLHEFFWLSKILLDHVSHHLHFLLDRSYLRWVDFLDSWLLAQHFLYTDLLSLEFVSNHIQPCFGLSFHFSYSLLKFWVQLSDLSFLLYLHVHDFLSLLHLQFSQLVFLADQPLLNLPQGSFFLKLELMGVQFLIVSVVSCVLQMIEIQRLKSLVSH